MFMCDFIILYTFLIFNSTEEIKVGVDRAVKEVVDPIKTSVSN